MHDLLYIHGFLSSPQSTKAQQLLAWAAQRTDIRVHAPALPVDPEAALAILESTRQACTTAPGLIGSSLGGFYANILAARHGLRAVLVNPAVHPHVLLKAYVGEQRNHHSGVVAEVRPEHFRLLERVESVPAHPERLWVLLETGDETLDYRQAEQFYRACALDITLGGTHSYEGFLRKLPAINEFLFE
ncbi:MAG: esterase [bacterium]|nr:esterase [bacterium]